MLEKTCSPVVLIILHLCHGSTGFRTGRDEAKKKPVRKRAKGRIRFGLSLDEKQPLYEGVVKFF